MLTDHRIKIFLYAHSRRLPLVLRIVFTEIGVYHLYFVTIVLFVGFAQGFSEILGQIYVEPQGAGACDPLKWVGLSTFPHRIAFFGEGTGAFQLIFRAEKLFDRGQLAFGNSVHAILKLAVFGVADDLFDRGVNQGRA